MIEFSIHLPSVLVGFFIGYILISIAWVATSIDRNWDEGYTAGCNARHEKEQLEEKVAKMNRGEHNDI